MKDIIAQIRYTFILILYLDICLWYIELLEFKNRRYSKAISLNMI